MRPEEKLRRVMEGIEAYKPERAILFGSYARGDADEYSDLDVIVIKRTGKRFFDRAIELAGLINPTFALDVLVYTPQEIEQMLDEGNSFLEMALSQGKVIYERP
jgi:predicted nucleotidyltransferase